MLSAAPDDIVRCTTERRVPKVVIRVSVEEVYLHCAKALMRSRLWDAQARVEGSALPTMGQMINDQTGIDTPPETREQMLERYTPDL